MGDDSSPESDTTESDDSTIDVEAEQRDWSDETDAVAAGPLGLTDEMIVEGLALAFVFAVVIELGKRLGRDLAWSLFR